MHLKYKNFRIYFNKKSCVLTFIVILTNITSGCRRTDTHSHILTNNATLNSLKQLFSLTEVKLYKVNNTFTRGSCALLLIYQSAALLPAVVGLCCCWFVVLCTY